MVGGPGQIGGKSRVKEYLSSGAIPIGLFLPYFPHSFIRMESVFPVTRTWKPCVQGAMPARRDHRELLSLQEGFPVPPWAHRTMVSLAHLKWIFIYGPRLKRGVSCSSVISRYLLRDAGCPPPPSHTRLPTRPSPGGPRPSLTGSPWPGTAALAASYTPAPRVRGNSRRGFCCSPSCSMTLEDQGEADSSLTRGPEPSWEFRSKR